MKTLDKIILYGTPLLVGAAVGITAAILLAPLLPGINFMAVLKIRNFDRSCCNCHCFGSNCCHCFSCIQGINMVSRQAIEA